MRRFAIVLLTLSPLFACASSEKRLDATWDRFQIEYDAAMARAERVCSAAAADARAKGDDQRLEYFTMPPGSPVYRLILASSLAGAAYMTEDLEAIETALKAVQVCADEMAKVEAELAPGAPVR